VTGRYLLDTNIVIAVFNGDTLLQRRVANAPEAFVSIVTLGELFYGAYHSRRIDANVVRIEQFETGITVLDCDSETSRHYGMVKAELRRQGTDPRERYMDRSAREPIRPDIGKSRPALLGSQRPPTRELVKR
jgi:tRNA(fMet)-specific endonuclease VapC